jgi:hypothetical protein
MKTYGEVDVQLHVFLHSELYGGFIPWGISTLTLYIGSWVGPQKSSGRRAGEKHFRSLPRIKP